MKGIVIWFIRASRIFDQQMPCVRCRQLLEHLSRGGVWLVTEMELDD